MNYLDIAENLFHHFQKQQTVDNYYGLLAIYALAQVASERKSNRLLNEVEELLERYPEDYLDFPFNFQAYLAGGNAAPYLLYMHKSGVISLTPKCKAKLEENVKKYSEATLLAPKSEDGVISMPSDTKKVWIDILMLSAPFMLFSGVVFDNQKYIDFAVDQAIKMFDIFLDPSCGLLHQSRGFMSDPLAISEDHWSRGNGWGYFGLAELVEYLPKTHPQYNEVLQKYTAMSQALLSFQDADGMWHQEMTVFEEKSWPETSGTALLLYGLGKGIRCQALKEDKFQKALEKGISELIKAGINADFSTNGSCWGCCCPGEGDEKGTIEAYLKYNGWFINEPHSFGTFMLALVEAHRNLV